MGVVKWVGWVAAALLVISVVAGLIVGIGMFVCAVLAIGSGLVFIAGIIMLIARLLMSFWKEAFS